MAIFRWLGAIIAAMFKGFLIVGALSAVLLAAWFLVLQHQAPRTADYFFIGIIVVLSGALGAAVALIYRLSHIGELRHVIHKATRTGQPGDANGKGRGGH